MKAELKDIGRLPSWWSTCGEAYPSHAQSGRASWCREHDGESERKLVDTQVESESEEGHFKELHLSSILHQTLWSALN